MANSSENREPFEIYLATSREFLAKGVEALSEEDFLQASEKFWGASAQMVKAMAERRGWQHSTHRALFQVVGRLAAETGDEELRDLFLEAGQLHTNFYENWLPPDMVSRGGERVKVLLDRLERAL